jgi:hypothetical protein
MLKLRHESDDGPEHFQVYTGQVRIGAIYKTSGNQWYWGLNGVENGLGPFDGFVRTLRTRRRSSRPPERRSSERRWLSSGCKGHYVF